MQTILPTFATNSGSSPSTLISAAERLAFPSFGSDARSPYSHSDASTLLITRFPDIEETIAGLLSIANVESVIVVLTVAEASSE